MDHAMECPAGETFKDGWCQTDLSAAAPCPTGTYRDTDSTEGSFDCRAPATDVIKTPPSASNTKTLGGHQCAGGFETDWTAGYWDAARSMNVEGYSVSSWKPRTDGCTHGTDECEWDAANSTRCGCKFETVVPACWDGQFKNLFYTGADAAAVCTAALAPDTFTASSLHRYQTNSACQQIEYQTKKFDCTGVPDGGQPKQYVWHTAHGAASLCAAADRTEETHADRGEQCFCARHDSSPMRSGRTSFCAQSGCGGSDHCSSDQSTCEGDPASPAKGGTEGTSLCTFSAGAMGDAPANIAATPPTCSCASGIFMRDGCKDGKPVKMWFDTAASCGEDGGTPFQWKSDKEDEEHAEEERCEGRWQNFEGIGQMRSVKPGQCAGQPDFGPPVDSWYFKSDCIGAVMAKSESASAHGDLSATCRCTEMPPPPKVCAAMTKVVCDGNGQAIQAVYAATDTLCSGTATQSPASDTAVVGWDSVTGRFNIGTCTNIGPSSAISHEHGDYTAIVTCVGSDGSNLAAGTAPVLGYQPEGGSNLPCTPADVAETFTWAEGDPELTGCICAEAENLLPVDIIPASDTGSSDADADTGCCACKAPVECSDTAGWSNGQSATCETYKAEGWCRGGEVVEDWTAGAFWNHPEGNCCACGGGRDRDSTCQDTAGWSNPAGLNCAAYVAEKFCARGSVKEQWAAGAAWGNPEDNCCACGRK
jgi:hypothetical protein